MLQYNVTSKIIATATMTLACLFLVFSYGIGLFGMLFPRPMVGLTRSLGLHNAATMFSMRVYRTDPQWALREMLQRAIVIEDHYAVVDFAERYIQIYINNEEDIPRWAMQALINSGLEIGMEINPGDNGGGGCCG